MSEKDDTKNFKIILFGDPNTGKTSVINSLCMNTYDNLIGPLSRFDYYYHSMYVGCKYITLEIWDTVGYDRYHVFMSI